MDFIKRFHPARSQQAILFGGNHLCMPAIGKEDLYGRVPIGRKLKNGPLNFGRFEEDLRREFGAICDIYPPRTQAHQTWVADFDGARMEVRVWVAGLRPQVTEQNLVDGLRASTSNAEFLKRIKKYGKTISWLRDCLRKDELQTLG